MLKKYNDSLTTSEDLPLMLIWKFEWSHCSRVQSQESGRATGTCSKTSSYPEIRKYVYFYQTLSGVTRR